MLFPGSQLGTKDNWTKVNSLSLTDYLNYENAKFSKSRGVGVFGNTAKDTQIHSDVWRFYLLSRRPETSDSEFKWQEFVDANNNELSVSILIILEPSSDSNDDTGLKTWAILSSEVR